MKLRLTQDLALILHYVSIHRQALPFLLPSYPYLSKTTQSMKQAVSIAGQICIWIQTFNVCSIKNVPRQKPTNQTSLDISGSRQYTEYYFILSYSTYKNSVCVHASTYMYT